jgi:adenosylmethionine-8-amino-7-oxononanoate aminotransferase
MMEGVATIAVKNMVSSVPPIVVTEAEIDDVIGRFVAAIKRAQDGYPRDVDYRGSSSLAIGKH